jgi:hypothetical protein
MKLRKIQILAVITAAALFAGCRKETVRVYDVPKDRPSASTAAYIPQGWEEAPLGEMRVNSFVVRSGTNKVAEISVIPLPNLGGKLLDNVNRWRSSIGLKPSTEEELAKDAKAVRVGAEAGNLFEMNGDSAEKDEPTRILGAIVNIDGTGWYFKIMGEDKAVAMQKPEFIKFLANYKFPKHDHDHGDHAGHNHTEDPHAGVAAQDPHAGLDVATAPPTPETGAPARAWPAPASWQQQTPGMMQDAKFVAGGGKAIVTVSTAGGDMLANIQRWRGPGQLNLPAISDAEAQKLAVPLDLNGAKATLVDLNGPTQRLIVVVVPKGQFSTFFKLIGEPAAVAAEKDALIEFAKKVK